MDNFTDDLYPALIRFSFEEEVARIDKALGYSPPVENCCLSCGRKHYGPNDTCSSCEQSMYGGR